MERMVQERGRGESSLSSLPDLSQLHLSHLVNQCSLQCMLRLRNSILNTSRTTSSWYSLQKLMSSTPNPPPAFQSTTTVWPIQGSSNGTKPATEPSTKSKPRNRNRKKAAAAAANSSSSSSLPPPVPSTSTRPKPTAQAGQETHRTNMPWRGSGRGRGRGGAQQIGSRGISTAAAPTTKGNGTGGDDGGVKVQRTALFQSAQAGVNSRRGVQTDSTKPGDATPSPLPPLPTPSASTSSPAVNRGGGGAGSRGAGRGAGGRGRGRGKLRGPPGGDRGMTLLDKVKAEAGEEDLEKQIHTLYEVSVLVLHRAISRTDLTIAM